MEHIWLQTCKKLFHISYSLPKLFDRPAKEKFKKRSTLTDGHFRHQEAKGQVPANQDRFPNPHQNNTTDEIENWTLRKVITFKKKKKSFDISTVSKTYIA